MTDIPIKVDVKGYSSASFSRAAIDTLIARGEQAAMKQWPKLMELKRKLGLDGVDARRRLRRTVPSSEALLFKIDSVCFDRIAEADSRYIVSKYGLERGDTVSAKRIEEAGLEVRAWDEEESLCRSFKKECPSSRVFLKKEEALEGAIPLALTE